MMVSGWTYWHLSPINLIQRSPLWPTSWGPCPLVFLFCSWYCCLNCPPSTPIQIQTYTLFKAHLPSHFLQESFCSHRACRSEWPCDKLTNVSPESWRFLSLHSWALPSPDAFLPQRLMKWAAEMLEMRRNVLLLSLCPVFCSWWADGYAKYSDRLHHQGEEDHGAEPATAEHARRTADHIGIFSGIKKGGHSSGI